MVQNPQSGTQQSANVLVKAKSEILRVIELLIEKLPNDVADLLMEVICVWWAIEIYSCLLWIIFLFIAYQVTSRLLYYSMQNNLKSKNHVLFFDMWFFLVFLQDLWILFCRSLILKFGSCMSVVCEGTTSTSSKELCNALQRVHAPMPVTMTLMILLI